MNYINKNNKLTFIIDSNDKNSIDSLNISNKELIEEIIIPENVKFINDEAFKGFTNLRKITLPNSLISIGRSAFRDCTNLKEINYSKNLKNIENYAFLNCSSLEEINLPSSTEFIGTMAFYGCRKVKSINIPENVSNIEYGAFSFIDSLTKITVDEKNKKYKSLDNIALINDEDGILIQYAIGNKNKLYKLEKYQSEIKDNKKVIKNKIIYNIADLAFANAKYLEELIINSSLDGIGSYTFLGCNNLKKLTINKSDFDKMLSFHIYNNQSYKDETKCNINYSIPFEDISIGEGIKEISIGMEKLFSNARVISLPNSLEKIETGAFKLNNYIKKFYFTKNIKNIEQDVFQDEVLICFEEFKSIMSNNFKSLTTKTSNDINLIIENKDILKTLCLKDNSYKIILDDFDVITISSKDIEKFSSHSSLITTKPENFIRHIITLIEYTLSPNANINNMFINDDFKKEYSDLFNNIDILKSIKNKNLQSIKDKILNLKNIYNEPLFNGLIINKCNKKETIMIADNMNKTLFKFLKKYNFFDNKPNDNQNIILNNIKNVIMYTKLLEEKKVSNPFFYEISFAILDLNIVSTLIENYNNNLKRCLLESKVLDYPPDSNNLNDIIKLLTVLGAFNKEEIVKQTATTFVTEKVILECNIIKDDFHTYFNEYMNPTFHKEYSIFFMKNYKRLLELEKTASGINSRIYNDFEDIANHNTSDKGSQRKLKITVDKCLNYFLINKFNGYKEEYKSLAEFLAKYYSNKETLNIAIQILNNAKNAPRNIFSKHKVVNGKIIYDNDPSNDLIHYCNNGYTYHWLPKQDINNLVLGKYCNCCAHILGVGAGIMRASMENNDVQNLVIENKDGLIIAKMTLYIDRSTGLGVFNATEISLNVDSSNYIKIYKAFMEGTKEFVKVYNENNNIPIKSISIGDKKNKFKNLLKEDNLGNEVFYKTLDYSKYQYYIDETKFGYHVGDAQGKQLLVYKK